MYHTKKKKKVTDFGFLTFGPWKSCWFTFCLGIVLSVNLEKCYKSYQKPFRVFITRLSLMRLIKSSSYQCLLGDIIIPTLQVRKKQFKEIIQGHTHVVTGGARTLIYSLFTIKSTEFFPLHRADCSIYLPHISSIYIRWI